MPIRIQFKGPLNFAADLKKQLTDGISDILNVNAFEVQKAAKTFAPKDMGFLANAIGVDRRKKLEKRITVDAFYAAYVEFGTGKYAAEYVARLPADWQAYARTFKGKNPEAGTFDEFLVRLIEWVHRKQIAGTYSVKTHKRTGKKGARLFEDASVAYAILLAILRNGIHPHPFLYPAIFNQTPIIEDQIQALIKKLT